MASRLRLARRQILCVPASQRERGSRVGRQTGEIWQNEHGPQGGDELNVILPGRS